MAVTSRGQLLKLNIAHPEDLPEQGVDNLDITISNMGVNNVQDTLLEVELPPQLVVLDQTNDRGVQVMNTAGSNTYRFTFGNIQPTERSTVRFRVRTAFGTMTETGSVRATAWQSSLPGDKLVETAVIKLRQ
jgi:spore germination protein YaaH